MKHFQKTAVAVLLVLALALSLFACVDGDDNGEKNGETVSSELGGADESSSDSLDNGDGERADESQTESDETTDDDGIEMPRIPV